jgi:hypothetical protein
MSGLVEKVRPKSIFQRFFGEALISISIVLAIWLCIYTSLMIFSLFI